MGAARKKAKISPRDLDFGGFRGCGDFTGFRGFRGFRGYLKPPQTPASASKERVAC